MNVHAAFAMPEGGEGRVEALAPLARG